MNLAAIPFDGLFKLIDSLFTTEDEKSKAKFAVMKLASDGKLAQLEVNKVEAANPSVFVSGWRPFIGWSCGMAFVWAFLISPILQSAAFYTFALSGTELDLSGVPVFDISSMMPVLMGMLGLGAMRSYEKGQGVARN